MILSVDPGLDVVALATWDARLTRVPAGALRSVEEFATSADDPITSRLAGICRWAVTVAERHDPRPTVYIEQPAHGGIYRRSEGKLSAVMAALYWSSMASAALAMGCREAGCAVHFLVAPTTRKALKQGVARYVIQQAGITLPQGRRAWHADELDAVAVGIQALRRGRQAA